MGEIADMMLDGTLCEGCGEFIDDEAPGYPRYCGGCRRDFQQVEHAQPAKKKDKCPNCGKRVKGLSDHMRDAHGVKS